MTSFYKDKPVVRYTMVLAEHSKKDLKALSKQYKLTQGDIIEVMLNNLDPEVTGPHFQAFRAAKVGDRGDKTALAKQLKNLDADRLARIQAILDEGMQ